MNYIKYGGFTVPMPKLNKKETRGGTRQRFIYETINLKYSNSTSINRRKL